MNILIQYEGFTVARTSRVYNFLVVDVLGESRQFTVEVPTDTFRSTSLKFQDGPPLSYELVRRALDRETEESPAKAHLNIRAEEIQEYLERRSPRKRS